MFALRHKLVICSRVVRATGLETCRASAGWWSGGEDGTCISKPRACFRFECSSIKEFKLWYEKWHRDHNTQQPTEWDSVAVLSMLGWTRGPPNCLTSFSVACQTDTLRGGKCHHYFKKTRRWVLLLQFMSDKSPAIPLMDAKPWQRESNQYKVRPFKFVLTTGRERCDSQEHTIRRK